MPNESESSSFLPSPSFTPAGATGGVNHRSSRFSVTAAAGQSAAAILVVIGLTIVFFNTSQHDVSASSLLGHEIFGNGKRVLKKALNHRGNNLGNRYSCEKDDNYSKETLKRAYELPYAALFQDQRGQKEYDASDVTIVGDEVYSVCDNSWAISRFGKSLLPFNEENVQVGDPNRVPDEDSGYEAIFHHEGLFYVVRESVYHGDHEERKSAASEMGEYHAIIEELELSENDYTVVNECRCEFEFEGDSKGFEGAVGFPDEDDVLYIVGLCEGNHCSESRKNDVGNGRVVLMKKSEDPEMTQCVWETVRVVNIPSSAAFLDYSAIDITLDGRVAITSQEHSAVWLGQANGIDNGIIDPIGFDFEVESTVLQFPKDGGCHNIYCNIEGIHFMNDDMLMAVSDKMESKERQDFRCRDKDQSIHAFVIP